MKKTSIAFLVMIMISGALTIFASGNYFVGSKTINLRPGQEGYMKIEMEKVSVGTIRAKTDHGRVRISVYNSRGKKVVEGNGVVKIRSGKNRENFKVVFTNKSDKLQKVEVSWIDVLSTDWG